MNAKWQPQGNDLRASVLELAHDCPVAHCNPFDCPLCELRKLCPEERLRWLDSLPQSDWEYLATYHHVCMSVKANELADRW